MKKNGANRSFKKKSLRRIYRSAVLDGVEVGSKQMSELILEGIDAMKHIALRDTFGLPQETIYAIAHASDLADALEEAEGDFDELDFIDKFSPDKRSQMLSLLSDVDQCHAIGISDQVSRDALRLINNMTTYVIRKQRMGGGDYRPLRSGRGGGLFIPWRTAA